MTAEPRRPSRRFDALVLLLMMLLPAALLGDSLFTSSKYLPFDIAEFPPIAQTLTAEQRSALRETANYDATEPPIWFAIELQLAREAVVKRQLPHWNPYVRGGAPMLAHGHLGLLNPLHWPALCFQDPADGLLYLTYAMFALAGAFMFGFLRAMQVGVAAAAFGALAFTWSGTLSANGHWFMRMEPLAMLPGMLWAIAAIANRSGMARAWPTAGLALTMAATWLSGFPQYGIPVTLLAAAFGLAFVLRELRSGPGAALRLASWLVLGAGLGALLAMPQLLQMLHFYPQSNRPIAESLDRAARHAFAPFGFLGYVMPDAFSHPNDTLLPQDASPLPYLWSDLHHWDTGEQLLPNYNFTEYALFPGTLPLLLAIVALFVRGPRWKWLAIVAFAGVWTLALGAFGSHRAFLLPGIKTVPPYRFAGPACALLAMLAAVGFDALRQQSRPWLLRFLALVLAGAGAYGIAESTRAVPAQTTAEDPWLQQIVERYRDVYSREIGVPPQEITPARALDWKFRPGDQDRPEVRHDAIKLARERLHWNLRRGGLAMMLGAGFLFFLSLRGRQAALRGWPTWLAIGFTAVELGLFGIHLNHGQPMPYAHDSPAHAFLREQRDAAAASGGFLVGRGAGVYGAYNLPGGTLAAEHIRDLNFYTFVDNKSDLPIRKLYKDAQILRGFVCDALPDDARLESPWWDLMGLRYVLATAPMQYAGQRVGPERIGNADYYIYERPHALPRSWFVPRLRVIDDETQLIDALVQPDLDPRQAALVSSADAARLPPAPASAPDTSTRKTSIVHEDGKRVTVACQAGAAGYLVLADTFFAGWEATIDGQPVPIARGNLYQRVVAVPAKACEVQFRFRAEGFSTGVMLGGAGLLGFCALLLFSLARPRQVVIEA